MKTVISLLICLLVCGCATEPEDRSFVSAAGIEKGFNVSLITADGSINSDNNEKNNNLISGNGKSLSQAIYNCEAKSSGQLFFGHTALCILDTDLFSDRSALGEITEFIKKDTQVSRRVIILAADKPAYIMSINAGGKDISDFAEEYYKAHKNITPTRVDELCRALAENGDIILPIVKGSKDGFEINGGVLLSDSVLSQRLTFEQMQCISLLKNDNTLPQIPVSIDGKEINVSIKNKTVKVSPEDIKIKLKFNIDDTDNITKTKTLALASAKNMALKGFEILQKNKCDVIGMRHAYEKAERYNEYSREVFKNTKLKLTVE